MKKTLIIATAAGLALSSGVEETQDNELIMNSIKNGYYTVSNAILSRPAMIAGGMQMIQNGMARPTFLNHFDETADDEFMAKGHGQGHEHSQGKQKGKKNKDGKKPRPQPVQEAQPVEQVQDNNLALEDDEFGALNVGVNGGNNGFGANAGYQGNIGRNGNWNVGGQIQTQPGGRPNWGVNAGVTIRFDEQDDQFFAEDQDDQFYAEDQDDEFFMQSVKNGYYTVSNAILSRPAMIAGGMQMIQNGMARPTFLNHFDETADDEFMAKGHGQGHEHSQGKQKGKKGKDGKKPRPQPQPVQEAQPIEQVQDNNLALEDDEFGALNVGVNGGNNGFGANAGYQGNIGRNGNWNVGGQIQTQPGGRPNWGVNAGVTIKFDEQDDEFFVEDLQDDELGALNVGVNGGNNGFGANAGYQGNIGRNGNWNVGGQIQTQPGGRPNWGVNAGVTIKFDEQDDEFFAEDQDDELFAEDFQDDELIMNSIKNGYYTVSNAILSRPAMIAGGMQMIQNGMARPTFLNHFDETADDEFAAAEKTEKPRRKRQPLERPEGMIKRNTKLRVPKEVAADNTLFDLAELLEDN